jgi:hypothetical protein
VSGAARQNPRPGAEIAAALSAGVHVPRSITDQFRRRGVDVLAAIEDAHSDSSSGGASLVGDLWSEQVWYTGGVHEKEYPQCL